MDDLINWTIEESKLHYILCNKERISIQRRFPPYNIFKPNNSIYNKNEQFYVTDEIEIYNRKISKDELYNLENQYDGKIASLNTDILSNWIISKFIKNEYIEYSDIVKKFGENISNFTITKTTVYINGIQVVDFSNNIIIWKFTMPSKWIYEMHNIINTNR